MAEVGKHYAPASGGDEASDHRPGVYRVVGAADEVVLLRVAAGDGRRIHTGEVVAVAPDTLDDDFEPAADPDAGFRPVAALRNAASGMYWSVRRFV